MIMRALLCLHQQCACKRGTCHFSQPRENNNRTAAGDGVALQVMLSHSPFPFMAAEGEAAARHRQLTGSNYYADVAAAHDSVGLLRSAGEGSSRCALRSRGVLGSRGVLSSRGGVSRRGVLA